MHSPLLTREAVRRSEHLVTDKVAKFLNILSIYASNARPVDLNNGFRCLAADIVMNFVFQRPLNALDSEGFQSPLLDGLDAWNLLFQWAAYLPRFFRGISSLVTCLPRTIISRFVKPFAVVYWLIDVSAARRIQWWLRIDVLAHEGEQESRKQIEYLRNDAPSEREIRTVFDNNLHPNLEKGQFTPAVDEMTSDAFIYLMAGMDTVSFTLVVIIWALLNNPQKMQELKAELKVVLPGRADAVNWAQLENLSYLVRHGLEAR